MKLFTIKTSAVLGILLILLFSNPINAQSLTDTSGNVYKTIKHGLQEWTAANLNVSQFRNGDIIPEAITPEAWIQAGAQGKPAWCYYSNDAANGSKFGKLYNYYAVNDPRGLAPNGWHIPLNRDWSVLVKNLLGIDIAGMKLKDQTGWKSNRGKNTIGFKALPGGSRDEKGAFAEAGNKGQWWTNSEPVEVAKSNMIFSVLMNGSSPEIRYIKVNKQLGLSVRCIRDKTQK